ncbi:hypothetical protein N0V82_009793 [Gnomoniopsis sp. IMI 355080]|nr:hypothetical protein N0V82_009793 [Gnomoniopsis sp. IMI 355080]
MPLAVVADLNSIKNALDIINEGLRRVDLATIGLPATAPALLELESIAVPLLENATAVFTASEPLDFEDTQSLVIATQALRSNLNVSINDFIAQKPLLDASGQASKISAQLASEANAALKMSSALLSKLDPDATQAQASLAQVANIFDRGTALLTNPSSVNSSAVALSGPFDPTADLSPVFILLPLPPVDGVGTLEPDGTCDCVAECPAGSFTQMTAM